MCCSVLQCVAVCCSVLQCVAVCGCALQRVAVCCSVLQCVAVLGSVGVPSFTKGTMPVFAELICHLVFDCFTLIRDISLES